MRIFLIGFMGCGKSTIGRKLARKMNFEFIDLDHFIELNSGQSISHFFNESGEDQFRMYENNALEEVIQRDNIVVATGGGTPCFFNNMDLMNENGITIYLKLDAGVIFRRLVDSRKVRPLLAGKTADELAEFIRTSLISREKFYCKAKIIANAFSFSVEQIQMMLNLPSSQPSSLS
ncbi:MAG: shikimate kinase [Bacteroidia bacterium]|nr:shikimate kinase [Bacteroidia bacterium]